MQLTNGKDNECFRAYTSHLIVACIRGVNIFYDSQTRRPEMNSRLALEMRQHWRTGEIYIVLYGIYNVRRVNKSIASTSILICSMIDLPLFIELFTRPYQRGVLVIREQNRTDKQFYFYLPHFCYFYLLHNGHAKIPRKVSFSTQNKVLYTLCTVIINCSGSNM